MIYLDNASTSFPKAPALQDAFSLYLDRHAGNPGRGGHRLASSTDAALEAVREQLKEFFGAVSARHCIFTANATDSIHIALHGILSQGDRVAFSPLIHNALFRPLHLLSQQETISLITLEIQDFKVKASYLKQILEKGVDLIAVNHMSNVTGHIEALGAIGEIIRAYPRTLFLVDAAQSAGHTEIDMQAMHIDMLALSGHKGLLGPAGSGALILSPKAAARIRAHRVGGSGIDSQNPLQPEELPWRLEAGTPNIPSILGLGHALKFVSETGIGLIHEKEGELAALLYDLLQDIPDIRLYTDSENPFIISFDHPAYTPSQWSALLDQEFEIACRSGLHCSPLIHRHLDTYPTGLVRLSPGYFNTRQDMINTAGAIRKLVAM